MQCQQTQKLEETLFWSIRICKGDKETHCNLEVLICGKVGDVQTKQLKVKIAGKGMGGQWSVTSLLSSPQFSCAS